MDKTALHGMFCILHGAQSHDITDVIGINLCTTNFYISFMIMEWFIREALIYMIYLSLVSKTIMNERGL